MSHPAKDNGKSAQEAQAKEAPTGSGAPESSGILRKERAIGDTMAGLGCFGRRRRTPPYLPKAPGAPALAVRSGHGRGHGKEKRGSWHAMKRHGVNVCIERRGARGAGGGRKSPGSPGCWSGAKRITERAAEHAREKRGSGGGEPLFEGATTPSWRRLHAYPETRILFLRVMRASPRVGV
jgi:hypothetical protein